MSGLQSLLFVSTSLIASADEAHEIKSILAIGEQRNAKLGVTGALVVTHRHFAEIIEGPADALAELMISIRRDRRHADLSEVDCLGIDRPTFARWAMAYHGPATYVGKRVEALLTGGGSADARELRSLIRELSRVH